MTSKIKSFEDAKKQFDKLMNSLSKAQRDDLLAHAVQEYMGLSVGDDSDDDEYRNADENLLDDPAAMLRTIAKEIRKRVPFEAILPSEKIQPPKKGPNSDCNPDVSQHVDGFLYDEDDVEELVKQGKIPRHYCKDCGSKNIDYIIFISHSFSREATYHIFNTLLPTLNGKTVLDVGSRLGSVLYGAYVYTDAKSIIGVEMNKDLCDLQNDIIQKYKMNKRIDVINKRIEDCAEVLRTADVVVLNNVFEFYLSEDEQRNAWQFLKENVKKGAYLVTLPSVETSLSTLATGIDVDKWLQATESSKSVDRDLINEDQQAEDDLSQTYCYQVL